MAHAVAWSAAARWIAQILSWASTIIVARILTPYDYGIVGMAGLYLNLAILVSQAGVGDAIIALRDLSDRQIAELNSFSLLMSAVLAGVTCVVAIPIARFFSAPPLVNVLVVSSIIYVFDGFQVVPRALLQRELRFKLLAWIETVKALFQIAVTVGFALLGFRYWSLVFGYIVSSATVSAMTFYYRRHPFAWPRFRRLRREMTFSYQVVLARLAYYAYDNSDFGVAGRVLGEVPLGNYTVAWTISSAPVEKISNLLMGVTPAYFSTLQTNKAELRRYLLRLTELLSFVTIPASIGLAVSAPFLVPVLLGPKWLGVVGPLRLLGLFVAVRSVATILPNLLTAIGDAGFVMWASVASAIVMPITFLIGSRWGTIGIAAGWAIAYPPMMLPFYFRVFRKTEMRIGSYVSAVLPALNASAIMGVIVLITYRLLPASNGPLANLVIIVLVGAFAYVGAVGLFHRERALRLITGIRNTLRARESVALDGAAK
ncbi:MAG TPA: lipopolysaccharide biosynthesis protein [Candidatus Acidoferrales bacterium]|nr:lipopolysaccharide biosynthesis protein [Candidatus Acidoferrales bacterium]